MDNGTRWPLARTINRINRVFSVTGGWSTTTGSKNNFSSTNLTNLEGIDIINELGFNLVYPLTSKITTPKWQRNPRSCRNKWIKIKRFVVPSFQKIAAFISVSLEPLCPPTRIVIFVKRLSTALHRSSFSFYQQSEYSKRIFVTRYRVFRTTILVAFDEFSNNSRELYLGVYLLNNVKNMTVQRSR